MACGAGLLAGLLLGATGTRGAESAPADWWQAQREVTATLLEGKKSLTQWVAEASGAEPANAQEAFARISVFLRAGMTVAAVQALRDLKALCPGLESYQVSSLYYDAGDGAGAWEVAQAAVELFADDLSDLSLENRLLKHLLDRGWTVDQVDRWLADRPRGKDGFWVKERLRFNTAQGRGEALVKALADGVRAAPADIPGALVFLDALMGARRGDEAKPDLSWLATTLKPALATQAADLGTRLQTLGDLVTAAGFLRQGVEIPFTEAEARSQAMQYQVFMPEEKVRAAFAARTREVLAECLLSLGRAAEAQTWMVAAADLREKNQLGANALLAGQVQAASGERVVEGRLKAEEQVAADDPKYWRERARYYRGRKESAQEEEALKRGLALAPPQLPPARAGKGGAQDERAWLLSDYAAFLQREKREDEAVVLLRQEMASAPAESTSAQAAARGLAFDLERQVAPTDEVLWTWLGSRPHWEHIEERLLWRLLENSPRNDLDRHVARAEKLTGGGDPSRAAVLGWVLSRMDRAARAVPLLQRAVSETTDNELRERAEFTLLESYLAIADWQRAEAMFPQAAGRLTARETPEWLGRIAVCAAKAGARSEALRIWSRVTNLDLTATGRLDELAKAGLREDLVAYYRDRQSKFPTSTAPAAALKALEAGTPSQP